MAQNNRQWLPPSALRGWSKVNVSDAAILVGAGNKLELDKTPKKAIGAERRPRVDNPEDQCDNKNISEQKKCLHDNNNRIVDVVGSGGGGCYSSTSSKNVKNCDNYSRFLSAFEFDDSFLTPWNWNRDDIVPNMGRSTGPKHYMHFQPGSFFSTEKQEHSVNPDEHCSGPQVHPTPNRIAAKRRPNGENWSEVHGLLLHTLGKPKQNK